MSVVSSFFRDLIDLKTGLDVEGTIYEIKNNKRMRGANAWMLMCSIVIASLGLDLNSPAVIIGAMLISPLMSPILGIGLGVGIADITTIRVSAQHFGIAIAIALITSTLYFSVTPIGELTSEIINRTSPTLLDVLVAFFGGVAGIISSSRKDKSNAIPGVAIATALMPPLCVTGFGIANGNWTIILNSFYLFFLNSFFVALATYVIVRYLNFPRINALVGRERIRMIIIVSFTSLLLIIPSILILRDVYEKLQLDRHVSMFMKGYFGERQKYIDNYEMLEGDPNRIVMKVYGNAINYSDTTNAKPALARYKLAGTKIEIIPTSEIDLDRFKQLSAAVEGMSKANQQILEARKQKSLEEMKIDSLINALKIIESDSILFQKLKNEVRAVFPDLTYLALGDALTTEFDSINTSSEVVIIDWEKGMSSRTKSLEEEKLLRYLKVRLESADVLLVRKTQ